MKILHFKSKNKISKIKDIKEIFFKVKVDFLKEKNFDILIFKDPKDKNILNRFEINENKVNIFSGNSTLNLELNKTVKNIYIDSQSNKSNFLEVKMIKLKKIIINKNINYEFKYEMKHLNKFIGLYHIFLKLEMN